VEEEEEEEAEDNDDYGGGGGGGGGGRGGEGVGRNGADGGAEEKCGVEEEEFMRCWKMFTHSFPGRVLSTNVYTDPAAESETTPTCGYATVCLSVCHARTAMKITSYLARCGRKVLSSCGTNVCVKS
jgi:hypothetical protein